MGFHSSPGWFLWLPWVPCPTVWNHFCSRPILTQLSISRSTPTTCSEYHCKCANRAESSYCNTSIVLRVRLSTVCSSCLQTGSRYVLEKLSPSCLAITVLPHCCISSAKLSCAQGCSGRLHLLPNIPEGCAAGYMGRPSEVGER